jgi:hypothetical protein
MVVGTPNRAIQAVTKASSQEAASMDFKGIASSHLEERSMTMNK